jgi:hypothetical protein
LLRAGQRSAPPLNCGVRRQRLSVAEYINGVAPDLAGRICQGFVCQQFFADGVLCDEANVTFLQFEGQWFRLYFEPGLIFWRSGVDVPHPWEVSENQWRYPHVDLGKTAGVIGQRLVRYDMWPTKDSARVSFEFANGKRILIEHKNDRGRYVVA